MWRPATVAFLGVYLVSSIAIVRQNQAAMILAVVGGVAASALRSLARFGRTRCTWPRSSAFFSDCRHSS